MKNETLKARNAELDEVDSLMKKFLDGMVAQDMAAMKEAFHPKALLAGSFLTEQIAGPVDRFLENVVRSKPEAVKPESVQTIYKNVRGDAACVICETKGLLGANYVDYYTLLRDDGEWKIMSKTFCKLE